MDNTQLVLRVSCALNDKQLCVLVADPATTILDVKTAVENAEGIPVLQQRLLLGHDICRNDSSYQNLS